MGILRKTFTIFKHGAYLTRCRLAYEKCNLSEKSARDLVNFGAPIILHAYERNTDLEPEDALCLLCGVILKGKDESPEIVFGAAYLYAQHKNKHYPSESQTKKLIDAMV